MVGVRKLGWKVEIGRILILGDGAVNGGKKTLVFEKGGSGSTYEEATEAMVREGGAAKGTRTRERKRSSVQGGVGLIQGGGEGPKGGKAYQKLRKGGGLKKKRLDGKWGSPPSED